MQISMTNMQLQLLAQCQQIMTLIGGTMTDLTSELTSVPVSSYISCVGDRGSGGDLNL